MPKKPIAGQKPNKSEEIRRVLKSGVHKPTEVQAKLAERGIDVSPQMVSTIKSKMSARRSARKIGRRRENSRPGVERICRLDGLAGRAFALPGRVSQ